MSVIAIQVATAPAPAGANVASIAVSVTDSSGNPPQSLSVNGTETPPFSLPSVTVSGNGSVTAQAQDPGGNNVGSPVTQAYTIGAAGIGVVPSGITVSTVTP